jgi:hypothetical protein
MRQIFKNASNFLENPTPTYFCAHRWINLIKRGEEQEGFLFYKNKHC